MTKTSFCLKKNLKIFLQLLSFYDKYTMKHSESVAYISASIAKEKGFCLSKIQKAYWAGYVHDLGKLLVNRATLLTPEELTDQQFQEIKNHSNWGYRILNSYDNLKDIAEAVRYHHEKWDGSGYPSGLKGEEIPLISRFIGIADAWDAMTTDRVYAKGLPFKVAKEEIITNKGTQFAPDVVDIMLKLLNKDKYIADRTKKHKKTPVSDFF